MKGKMVRTRVPVGALRQNVTLLLEQIAAVREGVARDVIFLAAAGIKPVLVHGGGKAITRAMEKSGLRADFVQGMRVTDEATVNVVEQVLSREINPEVVETLNRLNGKAK